MSEAQRAAAVAAECHVGLRVELLRRRQRLHARLDFAPLLFHPLLQLLVFGAARREQAAGGEGGGQAAHFLTPALAWAARFWSATSVASR